MQRRSNRFVCPRPGCLLRELRVRSLRRVNLDLCSHSTWSEHRTVRQEFMVGDPSREISCPARNLTGFRIYVVHTRLHVLIFALHGSQLHTEEQVFAVRRPSQMLLESIVAREL